MLRCSTIVGVATLSGWSAQGVLQYPVQSQVALPPQPESLATPPQQQPVGAPAMPLPEQVASVQPPPAPVVLQDPQALSNPQQLVARQATNSVLTLWRGMDMPEQREALSVPEKIIETPAERNVQVLGLQNSGVDLLNVMLMKNFGNHLNYYGSNVDETNNQRAGFWMHTDLQEKWRLERETVKPFSQDNIYALVMIRSPLSWLQAMRENPLELAECVQGEDWLTRPCVHNTPGGTGSRVPPTSYPSIEGLWNHFNTGFHNAGAYGLSRRLVVPYENLVRNPEGTMDMISKFLELPKPGQGWAVLSDQVRSREDAVKGLYSKGHLKLFSDMEHTQACVRLDSKIQAMYGYDECKKKSLNLLQTEGPALWDGRDLSADEVKSIDRRVGHGFLRRVIDTPATINVNVFGLQNSGVDLLNAMLHINFGNQLNYYSSGPADATTNSHHGHWMHANLKEKWRAEQATIARQKDQKLHAIIMIRNPLSWLQSMRAQPQELEQCTSGDDWLARPCTHKMPGGGDSPANALTYPSLGSVWNQWNDGYQNAAEYGFEHHVIITYESLVRNPKGTMGHIANFLGLKEPAQGWAMPSESAARDEALTALYTKRYIEVFTPQEKAQACGQLDTDLQRLYGYGDCEWTKYHQGQGARGGGEVHTGKAR